MTAPIPAALDALLAAIIRDVAELPGRTSPDDQPDAMIVTTDELRAILADALYAIQTNVEADSGAALEALKAQVETLTAIAAPTQQVSTWMIARSYPTGHGDTVEDLLAELECGATQRARASAEAALAEARAALRSTYQTVFLDGRNEHGSHVLTMPGSRVHHESVIEETLSEFAEDIISAAEKMGYQIGQCVVVSLWWNQDTESGGGHFEFCGISEPLTKLLCGSPEEQRAALEKMP